MDLADPRYESELRRLARGEERSTVLATPTLELDFRDYMMPGDEREERARIIGDVR